ncbi:MAG: TlpA disulfide reductase family protein [Chitinophagaceae bacterium]
MRLLLYCLLAILCPVKYNFAQTGPHKGPLLIGDTLPDLTLNNVLYHPASKIQLSDYKGKLVILDFWSSWCGGCIRLFPHMDSLQKQFQHRIQVILVNSNSRKSGDDEKKIRKIIDGVSGRTGTPLGLPVSFDNPVLDGYFPHSYIPHEVWLDTNGVIMAITDAEEVTALNIKNYLDGRQLSLRSKVDDFNFDETKPLFLNGNGGSGEIFLSRSVFAPYTEGLGTQTGQVNTSATSRLYAFNQSFLQLLTMAYPEAMNVLSNRLILHGKRIAELVNNPRNPALISQRFCYDLVVPATTETRLYNYLRQDLERCFNLQVKMIKKRISCWSLTATPNTYLTYTRNGQPTWDLDPSSKIKFMQNQPVPTVVQILNTFLSIPLIDETGIKKSIDLKLPSDLDNETALIQALRDAGFRVTKTYRTLPVTILSIN